VPVDANVFPITFTAPLPLFEPRVLPFGFSRYVQKEPPANPATSVLTTWPAVPLKLSPIAEVALIVFVTGVLKLIVSFVVWLVREAVTEPVTPLLGRIRIV